MVQYLVNTLGLCKAMYMPYTNNPNLPHIRMDAVRLVRAGWSLRRVGRHYGYSPSAIMNWMRRAPQDPRSVIPTRSSRPHHHPAELSCDLVEKIIALRHEYRRDAFFLHHLLRKEGWEVSLSSVKRTLKRNELIYPSRWKKWHQYPPRPTAEKPGILVEIDTVHVGAPQERVSLYTLLDVCSRWAHAHPCLKINTHRSLRFVDKARDMAPFDFQTLQSDHGAEFSRWFTKRILERGLFHRHSRIRAPNDNAHLERFNRTIQDECISRLPRNIIVWRKEVPEYLKYYNTERAHMGLNMKTPSEVLRSY